MRKSSRGNPYHDERGRFTTPNNSNPREVNYALRSELRKQGDYDSSESKNLRSLTRRALDSENGGKQGNWEIRRGGYDKWYEVYHQGQPVFAVIDGEVEVYQQNYAAYAEDFSIVSKYSMRP